MKKKHIRFSLLMLPVFSLLLMGHIGRLSGSPGGKTGSPGDLKATCTQCHTGTAENKDGWISSDIPETGYEAGMTYNISLSAEHNGVQKMGFEFTSEVSGGTKIGILDTDASAHMKLINSNNSITHTTAGTTPEGASRSWTFKWVAPESGSGDVTFYAAVNAADGSGSTSGDKIYTSKLVVTEQIDNSINQYLLEGWVKVYPNPTSDEISVRINGLISEDLECEFFNVQGQLINTKLLHLDGNSRVISSPVNDLPAGNYIIHMNTKDLKLKSRFLIVK